MDFSEYAEGDVAKRIIIGIAGAMGAGKTTAADELVRQFFVCKLSFATPLKEAACSLFGLKPEDFSQGKSVVDPYWGITRREMLQKLGTECMRENFGGDFWVRRAKLAVGKVREHMTVVFDDVRFPDEADWIRSNDGVLLRITRPMGEDVPGSSHASETQTFEVDATYDNNGTKSKLASYMSSLFSDIRESHGSR